MSVNLLVITHNRLGHDLVETASRMLDRTPLTVRVLPVSQDTDLESITARAHKLADELRGDHGLLVLTDAYGSTPSNIANGLRGASNMEIVAGINLPMLIRIFNYPELPLREMADAAVEAGRIGVMLCPGEEPGA